MAAVATRETISREALGQIWSHIDKDIPIREVSNEEVQNTTKWLLFHNPFPGYAANSRIGPCLVIGSSILENTSQRREYLVEPVTPVGSAVSLHRDKIYAVPINVKVQASAVPLNYITCFQKMIIGFDPQPESIGDSTVKLYEYTPKSDETPDDKSEEIEMTLKELNSLINDGDTNAEIALDIFQYTNVTLATALKLRTAHKRTALVDQRTICGDSPQRISSKLGASFKLTVDQNLLMPEFVRIAIGKLSK
jgi:hypothetical protein